MNSRAAQILSNATSLSAGANELAEEVGVTSGQVDALEQAAMDDRDAIAAASSVANETISLAEDLQGRVAQINVRLIIIRFTLVGLLFFSQAMIANLTEELNATELLSSVRLQEVNGTLRYLEDFAARNQKQVDSLTGEVGALV